MDDSKLDDSARRNICELLDASGISKEELIQSLWSGYGSLLRISLSECSHASAIVKSISLGDSVKASDGHPRGWNSTQSHMRKKRSYEVESEWYENWSSKCSSVCYVPKCLGQFKTSSQRTIVLEDLSESGYCAVRTSASPVAIKTALAWLANFHASFIHQKPDGLWPVGTYWHLDTRLEEYNAMKDSALKSAARAIDQELSNARFTTIVHGDAKLANFCFSEDDSQVAAVDFQYVGGGCGIKDVAYFLGSCLQEQQCKEHEAELLSHYFSELSHACQQRGFAQSEIKDLEREWQNLYPLAWADFHRFLKGWSPGHWKENSYSEQMISKALMIIGKN